MSEPRTGSDPHPAPPQPPPPPPAVRPRQEEPLRVLRRSTEDRMIGGVAGGLGRYFGIDPTLLQIAFVLLLFAGGSGFLLYVIGWIVIPEEAAGDAVGPPPPERIPAAGTELVGLLLVVVGAFLLLRVLLPDVFLGAGTSGRSR